MPWDLRANLELGRIEPQPTLLKGIGEDGVPAFRSVDGSVLSLVGEKDDFLILGKRKRGKGPYGQRGKGEDTR